MRKLVPLVVASVVETGSARADEWYGWETHAVDAAALTMVGVGEHVRSDDLRGLGLALYLAVPPMIHAAERGGTRAFQSLAARAGIPAGAYLIATLGRATSQDNIDVFPA